MKMTCETCASGIKALTEIKKVQSTTMFCTDPVAHKAFQEATQKFGDTFGCANWKPREIGTCGDCKWWDWEGNQKEAVWTSRFDGEESAKQEQEEAKHKGACLLHSPKGAYWFPATAKDQRGCGDWKPKPEGV